MLSGYTATNGLQGMGCGLTPCDGCSKGMGDLLDPSTWGPADWALAAGAAYLGWKMFGSALGMKDEFSYRRRVIRRFAD